MNLLKSVVCPKTKITQSSRTESEIHNLGFVWGIWFKGFQYTISAKKNSCFNSGSPCCCLLVAACPCELWSWKKKLFWAFWFATLTIGSLGNMWILSKWLISQRDYLVFAGSCWADLYFRQLPYSLKHWSVGPLVKDWDLGHGKQVLNLVCVTCGKPCRTQTVCTHS